MTIPQEVQAAFPDTTFNDSPRLANGERAMFVRILDKKAARKVFEQVKDLNPYAPAYLDKERKMLRVWSPDGDLVLAQLPTDDRCEHFICRLHKEVFAQ